jgi:hypothetical protein
MNEQELKAKSLELAVQLCSYNSLQLAENHEKGDFVDLLEKTALRYAKAFETYLSE